MENKYKDFDKMVDDIRTFIKNNENVVIVQNDDVSGLSIRYEDLTFGNMWKIHINDLANCIKSYGKLKRETLKKAFQTQEGKENLIKSFY